MSTPDAQPCKHPTIQTFRFADTGEPAGLWACADCRRKFAPLDVESAAEIERLRADAARYRWLTHDGERIGERMRGTLDAWDGCDGKAGFDVAIDAAMRDAPNDRGNRQ
jgi:hypothetical protein